jgi:hypothetical protein
MYKNPTKYYYRLARVFYIIISIFISNNAFSQGEANNWFFGNRVGITFNTGKPSPITTGLTETYDGSASISTRNGRMLFYADGTLVRDSTNKDIYRLTPGAFPSSNAVIIVPRPSHPQNYFIFNTDANGYKFGLRYSELSMNVGTGKLDSTKWNVELNSKASNKLTAVQHSNGVDFWVLNHLINSDKIYAWLVTSSGVNPYPVISRTGVYITKTTKDILGCMKVSPGGNKIAYANYDQDTCVIADFDPANGKVSNVWPFFAGTDHKNAFGVEFSASGKYLYISQNRQYGGQYGGLFQFDASAKTRNDFLASQVILDYHSNYEYAGMQLGPDKKIYITQWQTTNLHVIHAPDSAGKYCRLDKLSLLIRPGKNGWGYQMLPQFVQSFFNPLHKSQGNCLGDTAWFSLGENNGYDSIHWHFNDTASGNNNYAKGDRVFHLFSDTGKYKVRCIAFTKNFSDTFYFEALQKSNLGKLNELDRIVYKCVDDTISLNVSNNAQKILWSDKSGNPSIRVADTGLYWVKKFIGNGCFAIDTVQVLNYKSKLIQGPVSLGKDRIKCQGDSVIIDFYNPKSYKYTWNTGKSNIPLSVKNPDTISIKVAIGGSCYALDTIIITNYKAPTFTLGPDTSVCSGKSILIGYFEKFFENYLWGNASTSPYLETDTAGTYSLKIKDNKGCFYSDTIHVFESVLPKVKLGVDTTVCSNPFGFVLDAKNVSPFNKYKWGTAKISQTDTVYKTGKYWARVTNKCGSSIDTINLKVLTKPKALLPADTIFNGPVSLLLDGKNTNNDVEYYWNTKFTTQTLFVKDTGRYKLVVSNKCGKDSASIHVLKYPDLTSPKIIKSCIKNPVYFSILETTFLDSVKWDFGDTASKDNISKDIFNVSHVYYNDGTYNVTVILFYAHKRDTLRSIVSFNAPKPDFTVSDVCENDSVHFKNISAEMTTLSFRWKFGDGQNSTLVSPSYFYQIGGVSKTYNVTLVGKNSDGCADSISKAVSINANPNSDFTFTTNQNGVDFKSIQSGNTSYKWFFGNGDSALTEYITFKYPKSGKYTVCLNVTNAAGCFSQTCKEISVSVGISQIHQSNYFKVYPNPNNGMFTIEIENPAKDAEIEVFNSLGQIVKKVDRVEKVNLFDLDVSSGIYLLKMKNGGVVWNQRVLVSDGADTNR